jgi:hypothetical protein
MRIYLCFQSLPTTNAIIARFLAGISATTVGIGVRLNSNGSVDFLRNDTGATLFSSASGVIVADSATFYRFECKVILNVSAQITDVECCIDGASIGTTSGLTLATSSGLMQAGWCGAPGASKQCWIDDIAINDSTGAANNSWCGSGKIILMKPASDSQIGSWTGGAGGVTNLFDAVNNTPPIGTATETNLTQIESVDASGDNATDEYRGNCGSYATAGVGATDVVNAIVPYICHGEDVATGSKSGSFGLQANPVTTYEAFSFGNDAGALGTYATNWVLLTGTTVQAPSVTVGSNLIVAVRKTDTGTRVASVCLLAAYVDFTPTSTSLLIPTTVPTRMKM